MREDFIRKALIFGATSAIAQAIGRRLAAGGAELVLVGRSGPRLDAVAADARVRGSPSVTTEVADLDEFRAFPGIVARAFEVLGEVDLVLIAQGVLADSDACEADPAVAARVLTSDFTAPALLAQEAGLRLAGQGAGTLAIIGSVAGDRGRQSNYAYGAAKGGLAIFAAGLRNRLAPRGVHVLTVKPGFVDTPMTAAVPKNALFATPDRVASGVLRALERRADVVYTPGFWRAVLWAIRAIPERWFKRLRL